MSSAIQHHAHKLCGKERGMNQGVGSRGGVHQGPRDHMITKVAKEGTCPQQPTLGVSLQRSHFEYDQCSGPPASLPPAVSSPSHPEQQEHSRGGKVLNYTYSYCQPLAGEDSFGLGYLQAAQQKGKIPTVRLQQHNGASNPPPCQPLVLQGQRITLKQDGDGLVRVPRH